MVLNALSVDVEDYYQVSGFERQISRDHWHDYESRVVVNTQRLLDLFAAQQVQATFFVLGWVASHYPQLVRRSIPPVMNSGRTVIGIAWFTSKPRRNFGKTW